MNIVIVYSIYFNFLWMPAKAAEEKENSAAGYHAI